MGLVLKREENWAPDSDQIYTLLCHVRYLSFDGELQHVLRGIESMDLLVSNRLNKVVMHG